MPEFWPYLGNVEVHEIGVICLDFHQFFGGQGACVNVMLNVNMLMVKSKRRVSLWVSRSLEIIDSLVVLHLARVVFIEERLLLLDFLLCRIGKSLFLLLRDQVLELEFV